MATDEGNRLKWLAAGVVVVLAVGGLSWITAGPEAAPQSTAGSGPDATAQPRPEAEAQPVKYRRPEPQEPEPEPEQELEPGEVDLFAGDVDDLVVNAHTRLLDGRKLGVRLSKALYDYGQDHPDDPRPHLLMAHDGMKQDRFGISVRLYRMAWQADPIAKYDKKMLGDLVFVAATHGKVEHREAVEAIVMIYGNEALEEIDKSLESAHKSGRAKLIERLENLRSAVMR